MDGRTKQPTAGWYRNAVGQKQWWDGSAWGPIAPAPHGPGPALGEHALQEKKIASEISAGTRNASSEFKSTGIAYMFLLTLAGLGAHRFYLNSPGMAVVFIVAGFVTAWNLSFSDVLGPVFFAAAGLYLVLIVVDLCTLPRQVRARNEEIAMKSSVNSHPAF